MPEKNLIKNISVSNIVATSKLIFQNKSDIIDLNSFGEKGYGVFNKKGPPALYYTKSIKENVKTNLALYKNGNIVLFGSKNLENYEELLKNLIFDINFSNSGNIINCEEITPVNIVFSGIFEKELNLNLIYTVYSERKFTGLEEKFKEDVFVSYEPSKFAGLKIKKGKNFSCLLFKRGTFTVFLKEFGTEYVVEFLNELINFVGDNFE